ncbi:hypothetical protein RF11_01515 [Thelohanellus kitauei]|uniref:Uncharacterized protein n=1 Tax=Thelohanellus kitauei TaxID=669202 RepID=A0A0C2JI06_THEKT|nr:hypothetical protein RF11_01515 [Thelohanellus kitauei]
MIVIIFPQSSENTVVDFPSNNPIHRLTIVGNYTASCNWKSFVGEFSEDDDESRYSQSVQIQTYTSNWVTKYITLSLFFDLETHEKYYAFKNLGVDMKILDPPAVRLPGIPRITGKVDYNYRNREEYYISKRQTNCSYYNIQITLPEKNEIECSFLLNFTSLSFEFLEAETSECIKGGISDYSTKSTTTTKSKPIVASNKKVVYMIVGLSISIIVILSILGVVAMVYKKKFINLNFPIEHNVSAEKKI